MCVADGILFVGKMHHNFQENKTMWLSGKERERV